MEHFRFRGRSESIAYARRAPGGGGGEKLIRANPKGHGQGFVDRLEQFLEDQPSEAETQAPGYDGAVGRQVHFFFDLTYAGASSDFDAFGGAKQGIELINTLALEDKRYRVTLWVPFVATSFLIEQVKKYVDSDGAESKRWSSIDSIERVAVKSLYHDDLSYFPEDETRPTWFELWLVKSRDLVLDKIMKRLDGQIEPTRLEFQDRLVVLARVSTAQLVETGLIDLVADIVKPVFGVGQLYGMSTVDQSGLLTSVSGRILGSNDRVRVALLDSGVTVGHPLLSGIVDEDDTYAIDGGDCTDVLDHGTGIASLVLYGDKLHKLIERGDDIQPSSRLESVRMIGKRRGNRNKEDPKLYGYITARACYLLPTIDTDSRRIYVSTITADRKSRSGAPDSYSAALDSLSFGVSPILDEKDVYGPKLMIQSAGNSTVGEAREHLEPPGQAWNALTVGAHTRLPTQRSAAKHYLSSHESLSPSSSHGLGYEERRALKPDIVMEGGNAEHHDLEGHRKSPDCMLLGASSGFPGQHFTLLDGTSSAAGLAGYLAARIWQKYPQLTPESIRAIIINSASWTPQMETEFRPTEKADGYTQLVQQCGMGVPNPYTAIDSEEAYITMVFEDEIVPFASKTAGSDQEATIFHRIPLPWPVDELRSLAKTDVELRATLSYFVEPNPSNRDFANRYVYESFGLRFSFKRRGEDEANFCARISKLAETEENMELKRQDPKAKIKRASSDSKWCLGPDLRTRGSVHSDKWCGKAEQLVEMDQVAILPVKGWWCYSRDPQIRGKAVAYSLAISIRVVPSAVPSLFVKPTLHSAIKTLVEAETQKTFVDA